MDPGNCNICYKYFDSIKDRNIHIQRMHIYGIKHFKCLNCNNKDNIVKAFKKLGVYLRQKDAEWGLHFSVGFYNFGDHYGVTWKGAVFTCLCQEGRGYSDV